MGYTIVSGKPSSVPLHQHLALVFIQMLLVKCQIFVLNFIMPKTKWEGAEDPTINNLFKIESRKF